MKSIPWLKFYDLLCTAGEEKEKCVDQPSYPG